MNPEILQVLLELQQRSLKFGSPLIQQAFERLVPGHGDANSAAPAATPGGPSLLDALRTQQLIVEEVVRIHGLLLELLRSGWSGQAASGPEPRGSTETPVSADVPFASSVIESATAEPVLAEPVVAEPVVTESPADNEPSDASLQDALKQAERLLLLHPMAAQAAFSALVAQGRRFATTPEGQHLASALSASPLLAKLRRVWEATTLNMLEEQPTTVLPNMYVEAIFRAARSANLEDLLSAQRPAKETR
jgi:hypothetical protein